MWVSGGSVELIPVIEEGVTAYGTQEVFGREVEARYRGPDTFSHWEVMLRVPWYRAASWRLERVLRGVAALEFWTFDPHTGPGPGYIQWMFPYVDLYRSGFRTWKGTTLSGPPVVPEGIPDGEPITQGAFWKVKDIPAL